LVASFPVGTFLWETTSSSKASEKTNFDRQGAHLFTPQEASKLLSDIKPMIKELMEKKKVVAEIHAEMERYNLLGFMTAEVAERAAQLDALAEGMTKKVAELEDLGVIVKDLEFGLVDFPADRYGESVLLCWRYGEPEVSYWHLPDEGYVGRKPLKLQLIQP
jgi:hypothetical protein